MPGIIVLAGRPNYPPEVIASETITPGQLIQFVPSGGTAGQLRKHTPAGGDAAAMFAVESLVPSIANSQTAPIDLTYASNDSVRWVMAQGGDVIYGWVPAAAVAIKRGDLLVSNGDGTVKKYAAQATNEGGAGAYTIEVAATIGMADEDLDNSGGGAAARLRIRVL